MNNFPLMSLDIGTRRIGVAICQDETSGPRPMGTFTRAQGRAEREIIRLIQDLGVGTIIAGLPLDERGSLTEQCESVHQFCRRLQRRSTVHVIYQDEYSSTEDAKEHLIRKNGGQKVRNGRDRGVLDALSAAIILQSYLQTNNTRPST